MTHSPTPWRVGTNGHVVDADGVQVAIIDHGSGAHSVKRANAKMIVEAVNAYMALAHEAASKTGIK